MTDWHRSTADYWDNKSVVVTGGAGFLGRHLVEELEYRGKNTDVYVPRSDKYDLPTKEAIRRTLTDSNPDVVLHLTGFEGDIEWNKPKPDGQPRRQLDASRARAWFICEATTDFKTGLQQTVKW